MFRVASRQIVGSLSLRSSANGGFSHGSRFFSVSAWLRSGGIDPRKSKDLKKPIDETIAVPASKFDFPSAFPYLHLRTGRKNEICINKEEVEQAIKNLPWRFKVGFDARGNFIGARYSARSRKALRARTLAAGKVWPWDVPRKQMIRVLPFKGRKRWRLAVERIESIKKNMADMPRKIEEYRANKRAGKLTSTRYLAKKKGRAGVLEKIRAAQDAKQAKLKPKGK